MLSMDLEVPKTSKVIVAQKPLFKGALFGHISNGGGVVDLGNGYSIEFIANEKFCTMQLYKHALNVAVQTQKWQKSKKVTTPKKETVTEKIETTIEEGDLF